MQTRVFTRSLATALVTGLILVPALTVVTTAAEASDRERAVDFIGVFHPVPVAFGVDPVRCPDATHPFLISFRGQAWTTAGHALFEQSHCEAVDHTSFRRGEQTITFDNGDQLFGAYSGELHATPTTATDNKLIIDGFYRNRGGTGAISGARGRGISVGVVDTVRGVAEVTVSGTL